MKKIDHIQLTLPYKQHLWKTHSYRNNDNVDDEIPFYKALLLFRFFFAVKKDALESIYKDVLTSFLAEAQNTQKEKVHH